jgi:DNA-damage-inducible protein J
MNLQTQILNIRIDSGTKNKAKKIAEEIGLDLSSAIKLFLNKMIQTNSIPFEINTGKGRMNNPKYIKSLKKDIEWTKKYGKRYSSTKELLKDLNS